MRCPCQLGAFDFGGYLSPDYFEVQETGKKCELKVKEGISKKKGICCEHGDHGVSNEVYVAEKACWSGEIGNWISKSSWTDKKLHPKYCNSKNANMKK